MNRQDFLPIFGLLLVWAGAVQADEIRLKNGQTVVCEIQRLESGRVMVEVKAGAGSAQIPYPAGQIAGIRFVLSAEEQRLLESVAVADLPSVQAFWERRRPFLNTVESDAGAVGARLVRLLLLKQEPAAARTALELCALLEKEDWNEARRVTVKSLRLQALLQSGQTDAAVAEARQMADLSPEDGALMVEARFVLAKTAVGKMRELERKNPKWQELRDRRAEQDAWLQQALDGFLAAPVFCPENTRLAARGLWNAAELADSSGREAEAKIAAQEIVDRFPEPEFLPAARALLAKLTAVTPKKDPS